MKKILVLSVFVAMAQASEFRLSDDLYHEAVREMKDPSAKSPASDSGVEWSRCIEMMEQGKPEGKQDLEALLKKLNLFAADADIAAALAAHEAMLKGEPQATLQIAIALIKGEFGYLIFPQSPKLALPYLEQLLDD